jgi:hypothetical protein
MIIYELELRLSYSRFFHMVQNQLFMRVGTIKLLRKALIE